MNGELAEVISLAGHGSVWLRDQDAVPPALERENSTFQYVGGVRFVQPAKRFRRLGREANDVATWFRQLAADGVSRLWLVLGRDAAGSVDEHIAVAFAGAGSWGLLATGTRPPLLWSARWEVADDRAPDSRIWGVTHVGSALPDAAVSRPSIARCQAELLFRLEDARQFAQKHELEDWAEWFGQAIALGDDGDPVAPYHPDMLPASGYSPDARRLLAIATQSWVFGGMGSWNDLGFDVVQNGVAYHELSASLYTAMLAAFVASINSELV